MNDILEELQRKALEKARSYPDGCFMIRGLWRIDYVYRPPDTERTLDYPCILALTAGHGFSYCDKTSVPLDRTVIGKDARDVRPHEISTEIAVLDAVYSVFEKKPDASFTLDGHPNEKTPTRAKIIVDEVVRELGMWKGEKPKVVNVGVFFGFVKGLRERGLEVFATDLDPKIIGRKVGDVRIESGAKTLERVEECDLALVTGMTLSTQTLGGIIDAARKNGTKLMIYAQTGSNFAEEYCSVFGVDVVVSEYFPFYWCPGKSSISIYRRRGLPRQ